MMGAGRCYQQVLTTLVSSHGQEWETLFAGLAANRHHKRLAWRMLTRHWDAVYKVWGQSQFKMKAIIGHAMSKADPDEVEAFFESHPCDLVSLWHPLKQHTTDHHSISAILLDLGNPNLRHSRALPVIIQQVGV